MRRAGFDLSKYKLAALGASTAQSVENTFGRVDFVGRSEDTEEVALQFRDVLATDLVYFPVSSLSLRKIQKAIPVNQIIEQVAYETSTKRVDLDWTDFDVCIISSPSNAQAYFNNNGRLNVQFIAFGQSTKQALIDLGAEYVTTPEEISKDELFEVVKTFVE